MMILNTDSGSHHQFAKRSKSAVCGGWVDALKRYHRVEASSSG
jgi:hypothetical protein